MRIYSATDVGQKRKMNQDYVFASQDTVGNLPNLFAVADGMGGHNAGDYASSSVDIDHIICLNNNFLGNVRQWQAMFFNRRYSFTPMLNPDYMKIASAYDIPSKRVYSREELKVAIDEMLATDGPFLLEACVIEEGNVLPMTPPGGSVNQMLLEC